MSAKRWKSAPNNGSRLQSGQLTGVQLSTNEKVNWSWTFAPDGSQLVTGYEIISDSDKVKPARKRRRMGFTPDKS
jgi:hypothetical protein